MARVAAHLSVEDLEAGFRSARDPTATRHFQVIWLLARGHTIADVAAVTSFGRRSVPSSCSPATTRTGPRPWATCAGATGACQVCSGPRFSSGCVRA